MTSIVTPGGRIVSRAFRETLNTILLISTKHPKSPPLRDAAYATRERGYPPREVLYVFLLACEMYGHQNLNRPLLFQCLTNLVKLLSLNVITLTNAESRAVCDLVRCLAFRHTRLGGRDVPSDTSDTSLSGNSNSTFADHAASSLRTNMSEREQNQSFLFASTVKIPSVRVVDRLVHDTELIFHLVQVVLGLSAVCAPESGMLAEPLGLLFGIYPNVLAGSMAHELLTVSLVQRTHAYLDALLHADRRLDQTVNTNLSEGVAQPKPVLPLLLQALGYFEDLCDLATGQLPKKGLTLNTRPLGQQGLPPLRIDSRSGIAFQTWFERMEAVKRAYEKVSLDADPSAWGGQVPGNCLRRFALDLLLTYFTEVKGEGDFLGDSTSSLCSCSASASTVLDRNPTKRTCVGEKSGALQGRRENCLAPFELPCSRVGVFFVQCLNEKVGSLALGCGPYPSTRDRTGPSLSGHFFPDQDEDAEGALGQSMRRSLDLLNNARATEWEHDNGAPPLVKVVGGSWVNAHSHGAKHSCRPLDAEFFVGTQTLAVLALRKFPIAMRNTAPKIAGYHAALLRELRTQQLPQLFRGYTSDKGALEAATGLQKAMQPGLSDAALHEGVHATFSVLALWKDFAGGQDCVLDDLKLVNCALVRSFQPDTTSSSSGGVDERLEGAQTGYCAFTELFSEAAWLLMAMLEAFDLYLSPNAQRGGGVNASMDHNLPTLDLKALVESAKAPKCGPTEHAVEATGVETAGSSPTLWRKGTSVRSRSPSGRTGLYGPPAMSVDSAKWLSYLVDLLELLRTFASRFVGALQMLGEEPCLSASKKAAPRPTSLQGQQPDVFYQIKPFFRRVFVHLHPLTLQCVGCVLAQHEPVDRLVRGALAVAEEGVTITSLLELPELQDEYLHTLHHALLYHDGVCPRSVSPIGTPRESRETMPGGEGAGFWPQSPPASVAPQRLFAVEEEPLHHPALPNTKPYAAPDTVEEASLQGWVAGKMRRLSLNLGRTTRAARPSAGAGPKTPVSKQQSAVLSSLDQETLAARTGGAAQLQRALAILHTLFAIAQHAVTGAGSLRLASSGWAILARAFCQVEPLRAEAQERYAELSSEALGFREAMHQLCLDAARDLPVQAFEDFLRAVVYATAEALKAAQKDLESSVTVATGDALSLVAPALGALHHFELAFESLGLAALGVVPREAARAAQIAHWMRWLCANLLRPSQLSRWVLVLQRASPRLTSTDRKGKSPSLSTRTGLAPLEHLHGVLRATLGDVATVAAFVSTWAGRLHGVLENGASGQPGEGLEAWVLAPHLPPGLTLSGQLGAVARATLHSQRIDAASDVGELVKQLLGPASGGGSDFFGLLTELYSGFSELARRPPSEEATVKEEFAGRSACLGLFLALCTAALHDVLAVLKGCGQDLSGASWSHLLRLAREAVQAAAAASRELRALEEAKTHRARPDFSVGGTGKTSLVPLEAAGAALEESVQLAYQVLEVVQQNHIPQLDRDALRELVSGAGAFIAHDLVVAAGHPRHLNLRAVQMIWSIVDFLAAPHRAPKARPNPREEDLDREDDSARRRRSDWDALVCAVLLHLHHDGCLDTRREVRQSAQRTLLSILQTYGGALTGEAWDCVLREILGPLMEIVREAERECAILPPSTSAARPVLSKLACQSPVHVTQAAERRSQLLCALTAEPGQIPEMRLTLTDAIGRILTSYEGQARVMLRGLSRAGTTVDVLDEMIEQFVRFCAATRVVVRETTGVEPALVAIRALGALALAPAPQSDVKGICDSFEAPSTSANARARRIWHALRGLLLRDPATQHTRPVQSIDAVVSELLVTLGRIFCLWRTTGLPPVGLPSAASSTSCPAAAKGKWSGLHSYWKPPVTVGSDSNDALARRDLGTDFEELLEVLVAAATCEAMRQSYHFPNSIQIALGEVNRAIWPHLGLQERGVLLDKVIWPQFPSQETALLTGAERPRATTATLPHPSKAVLPLGAHPNVFLWMLDWIYQVALAPSLAGGDQTQESQSEAVTGPACAAQVSQEGQKSKASGRPKVRAGAESQRAQSEPEEKHALAMAEAAFVAEVLARFLRTVQTLLRLHCAAAVVLPARFFPACLAHFRALADTFVLLRPLAPPSGRHEHENKEELSHSSHVWQSSSARSLVRRAGLGSFATLYRELLQHATSMLTKGNEAHDAAPRRNNHCSVEHEQNASPADPATTEVVLNEAHKEVIVVLEELTDLVGLFIEEESLNASFPPKDADPTAALSSEYKKEGKEAPQNESLKVLIEGLVQASLVTTPGLAGVATRGLAFLDRWYVCPVEELTTLTGTETRTTTPTPKSIPWSLRKRVRVALQMRDRNLLEQFWRNPMLGSTVQATRNWLWSIRERCLSSLNRPGDVSKHSTEDDGDGGGSGSRSTRDAIMDERVYICELLPELSKLVGWADPRTVRTAEEIDQEKELRQALLQALLSSYQLLGFRTASQ